MQPRLAQYPKIDLGYGENDPMALSAYLAAGARKDIKFIGVNGLAIPDGGIRAVQLGQRSAKFVLDTTEVTAADAAALYKHHDFSQTAASQ